MCTYPAPYTHMTLYHHDTHELPKQLKAEHDLCRDETTEGHYEHTDSTIGQER